MHKVEKVWQSNPTGILTWESPFLTFSDLCIQVIPFSSQTRLLISTFFLEGKARCHAPYGRSQFLTFFLPVPVSFHNCSLNQLGFTVVVPLLSGWPFYSFWVLVGSLYNHSRHHIQFCFWSGNNMVKLYINFHTIFLIYELKWF